MTRYAFIHSVLCHCNLMPFNRLNEAYHSGNSAPTTALRVGAFDADLSMESNRQMKCPQPITHWRGHNLNGFNEPLFEFCAVWHLFQLHQFPVHNVEYFTCKLSVPFNQFVRSVIYHNWAIFPNNTRKILSFCPNPCRRQVADAKNKLRNFTIFFLVTRNYLSERKYNDNFIEK